MRISSRRTISTVLATVVAALAAIPATAAADVDPAGCTDEVTFDPTIRTFKQVTGIDLGAGGTGSSSRNLTPVLYSYLDAGRNDAAFWRGVRAGGVSEEDALAAVNTRPAFGWIAANVHGNEPAGGEASLRLLYEMAARTDCANAQRLANTDFFVMPSQNPDGRDTGAGGNRTNAWNFDLNRDWGTLTQTENELKIEAGLLYPPVVYIDAHQQNSGYFFPPNEDPIHHEVSDAAIDAINNVYGPALQKRFNDQSVAYQNYNAYDLFAPEYGDSVPALLFGAAGMTYEKGTSEVYGKQVYDHYLALDETVNVTSRKKRQLLTNWIKQWPEAEAEGAAGTLEPNELVSPVHSPAELITQPSGSVYGYFYLPDNHAGDAARLVTRMQETGVHVYRLNQATTVDGVHTFGPAGTTNGFQLPAGTLFIPSDQRLKHWIQAVLGEDPFQPFAFCYDVCTFSFSLLRGMSGNGILTQALPAGTSMTEITDPDFGSAPASPQDTYVFSTDSSSGLSLLYDLLEGGATVARSSAAFSAGGKQFPTGSAIVDGSTLGSLDLGQLAEKWETPITGLGSEPSVAHYAVTKPKIALYAGTSTPVNPLSATPGMCTGTYCQALFVLTQKLDIPISDISLVTLADLNTSATYLSTNGFTAFVNPAGTINAAGNTNALASIRDLVNTGGRYVGWGTAGTTTARNAAITNLNTQSISGLYTQGATFTGTFDSTQKVAWGFDNGGFIFRSATGDPVFDPASLTAATPNAGLPAATAVVSYPNPLTTFGYQRNSLGSGQLPGRPAVVDQPFGSGHAVLLGFDPIYRAWIDSSERLLLNALFYPGGAEIPANAPLAAPSAPGADPIPTAQLPAVGDHPTATRDTSRDLTISVDAGSAKTLRIAVRKAHPPKQIKARAKFIRANGLLTYRVRNAAKGDVQDGAPKWVRKVITRLNKAGVTPAGLNL